MLSVFLAAFFSLAAWGADPVVRVEQGLLRGSQSDGVDSFKAIPYAAPPVQKLRWRAPQPPEPWPGERDATNFGPACPQTKFYRPHGRMVGNEDCLSLNVWRPKGAKNLPVLVFLHGGIFAWGSSADEIAGRNLYEGSPLAAQGPAIVVTVNYRLGALGFLAHPALRKRDAVRGNFGLQDQIAALRWVRENISQFGGDPSRVLLFGESAGGGSVLSLLAAPSAQGLFSSAMLQSAPLLRETLASAESVGAQFGEAAGCEKKSDKVACLRGLSPEAVLKASASLLEKSPRIVFGPNIDGHFLPDSPYKALESGNFHPVPVIVGTNSEEMNLLALPQLLKKPIFLRSDYEQEVIAEFGEEAGRKVLAQYPVESFLTPLDAVKAVFNDAIFHCPAQRVAEALQTDGRQPVWRYVFTHSFHLDPFRLLGAAHALDLAFTFQSFAPWYSIFAPNKAERLLAQEMGNYWIRLAGRGDPNDPSLPNKWPSFGAEANHLELDTPSRTGKEYRAQACTFWRKLEL